MSDNLMVLWTSGDREVALKVVLMYVRNAEKNNWWDEVELVIWGPSAKLLSGDEELQVYIKEMVDNNIKVRACKACSDLYGVSDELAKLGIDVVYMGKPLTDRLKSSWKVITF